MYYIIYIEKEYPLSSNCSERPILTSVSIHVFKKDDPNSDKEYSCTNTKYSKYSL